jgi:hypothetical protein
LTSPFKGRFKKKNSKKGAPKTSADSNNSNHEPKNLKSLSVENISWAFFIVLLGLWGFYLGLTSPTGTFRLWHRDPQDVLLYTESDELAGIFKDLKFRDWNLKIVVIDEPTEWEIKTVTGHGAHLLMIEHAKMQQLNQVSLLERAKIRVPLFSYLAADFRKQDWEKVYLALFWKSKTASLNDLSVWGLSVPTNSPDRILSWKAFYEIVGHPSFKARLIQSGLGLTLNEFEESPIPAERKPSFVRQRKVP